MHNAWHGRCEVCNGCIMHGMVGARFVKATSMRNFLHNDDIALNEFSGGASQSLKVCSPLHYEGPHMQPTACMDDSQRLLLIKCRQLCLFIYACIR